MASFWPQICIKSVSSRSTPSASRSRRLRNEVFEVVIGQRENGFPGPAVDLAGLVTADMSSLAGRSRHGRGPAIVKALLLTVGSRHSINVIPTA